MLKAMIAQHFPKIEVDGVMDPLNSGNFLVSTESGTVLSPYGFVDTTSRRRLLLEKVDKLY